MQKEILIRQSWSMVLEFQGIE